MKKSYVLLAEGGAGACFLVYLLESVAEVGGVDVGGRVEVDEVCGVHEKVWPAQKLVLANASRSCTSCSALQARWNKRVIVL